jgi:hypothetical protein
MYLIKSLQFVSTSRGVSRAIPSTIVTQWTCHIDLCHWGRHFFPLPMSSCSAVLSGLCQAMMRNFLASELQKMAQTISPGYKQTTKMSIQLSHQCHTWRGYTNHLVSRRGHVLWLARRSVLKVFLLVTLYQPTVTVTNQGKRRKFEQETTHISLKTTKKVMVNIIHHLTQWHIENCACLKHLLSNTSVHLNLQFSIK